MQRLKKDSMMTQSELTGFAQLSVGHKHGNFFNVRGLHVRQNIFHNIFRADLSPRASVRFCTCYCICVDRLFLVFSVADVCVHSQAVCQKISHLQHVC